MKKYILSLVMFSFLFSFSTTFASVNRNLTIGSTGDDVKELQTKLSINPTGYFGSLTKKAVIKWQVQNNLPSTGYFGKVSRGVWNKLNGNVSCNVKSSYDTLIPSCTCPTGYKYKLFAILDNGSNKYGCVIDNTKNQENTQQVTYSLITPNGGEIIQAGSVYEIKWNPTLLGNVDNVSLSLEDDSIKCQPMSMGCWSSFGIDSVKNTGSYMWDTSKKLFGDAGPNTIEVTPKTTYRISVSANSINLESQNTFSISSNGSKG